MFSLYCNALRIKIILFALFTVSSLSAIGYIFWIQEWQYTRPTPKPANIKVVNQGDKISLPLIKQSDKPLFLHFYNYDCPCSRFNIKEFESMVKRFSGEVTFYAILQTDDNDLSVSQFKKKYDLGIQIIEDKEGLIAAELGVYSTPQAVIIKNNQLYFKGNYNKARFCTTKNTKFAELALRALLKGEKAPVFPEIALISYGCELPSNTTHKEQLLSIFNF